MSSEDAPAMQPGALSIKGVGKAYRLYGNKWGRAAEWLGLGRRHHLHWVLNDINLELSPGEALGVVGENGAGKSTLLKLITGVSRPTAGHIEVVGQISALLELGIGFNAAFTGRQNAVHTLRLSGVPEAQLADLLTDIETFADLGDYFDYPVRMYSSGMQCRLGFATATATRPDVLIVDEALAVGDIFFQQRCYDRISDFRERGTTLLFVSHSAPAVFALCDRAVLLQDGAVAIDGSPREVIDLYNAQVVARSSGAGMKVVSQQEGAAADAPGVTFKEEACAQDVDQAAGEATTTGSYSAGATRLASVAVLQHQKPAAAVMTDAPMTVRVSAQFQDAVTDPHVGFQVRDTRGEVLYRAHTHGLGAVLGDASAGDVIEVDFSFAPDLMPGDYTLTVGIGAGGKAAGALAHSLLRHQDVVSFSVIRSTEDDFWDGVVNLRPQVVCRRLREADPS